jgi:peptide/nickel transport system permease protein
MLPYVLHRVLALFPTLLVVSVVVFGLQQMLPGDVAQAMAGEDQDPQVIAQIRRTYRLDEPIPVRYALWLGGVLQGNLGISLRNQVPVSDLILQKLPATLLLATMAMAWAFAIGIPAGVLAALRKGSALDHLANVVGLAGLSVPPFWLGLMLILLVSVNLGLLPASGYVSPFVSPGDALRSLLMPSFVLGASAAAVLMRHTRSAMLAALRSDYVRTARAKGLYERLVILRHAFRNALIPIITMAALQTGQLLSGTVLTEQVFTIPGFGRLIVDAVFTRDYAVVQGVVLVTALIYVLLNLAADVAYGLADPKMRKA